MTHTPITLALTLALALLPATPAFAQPKADGHAGHHGSGPTSSPASSPTSSPAANEPSAATADMAEGEVRRIDKAGGRMTLKHGEIKSLDMPGMTMVFQVKDPALLDKVQVGDKVRFRAEKAGSGFVVTAIERAR